VNAPRRSSHRARENGAHYSRRRSRAAREYGGIGAKVARRRHQVAEEDELRSAVDHASFRARRLRSTRPHGWLARPLSSLRTFRRIGPSRCPRPRRTQRPKAQPPNRLCAITNRIALELQAQRESVFRLTIASRMTALDGGTAARGRGCERRRPRDFLSAVPASAGKLFVQQARWSFVSTPQRGHVRRPWMRRSRRSLDDRERGNEFWDNAEPLRDRLL